MEQTPRAAITAEAHEYLKGDILDVLFVYSDNDTMLKIYDCQNPDGYGNPKKITQFIYGD